MKNILVVGAGGQIGSELVPFLRKQYGANNVIAADIDEDKCKKLSEGPWEKLDATDGNRFLEIVKKYKIDTIYNMVALLSATGEKNPELAWKINMGALENSLNIAKEHNCAVFTPSSIGAFGPTTPKDNTPQDTIMQPNTIYGVCKVSGELLSNYYYQRYGVDTRSVRFPGIISNVTLPGGGTTDYAVEIYYEAIKKQQYTCNLQKGTFLDMMYMPDAVKACVDLMEANPEKLIHRNSFNISAMSFDPEMIGDEIKKHIPEFNMDYNIDKVKQTIADSWPNSMDDNCAREEWGWNPQFNLAAMTIDMLEKIEEKHQNGLI
ncbi:putative epimerase/dehydratase [Salinivirga cyanobacteriivorans]|uniref:Putative epimerase/dehydratase n=1 Tax=Salinivirga cyanobacteriivorans TaxID=1307839 RepID=A0A0S2I1B9_9BACT|nr:L-threonine 3-dehydrogenase [Salinivirga cyanobacteriivorans]ALO16043.1 putative epimerase/dehydratase [Salinivirga cyanobacteriivorans]